jgi:hypothetical protein
MKPLPVILSLVAAGLAVGFAYEVQQVTHLQQVVAQMERDAAAARGQADSDAGEVRKLKEQVKTYQVSVSQLEAINKELNSGKPGGNAANAAPGEPAVEKPAGAGFMKNLAKMFNDPKMKEMMRAQQATGVNMMYGSLAKELGLSPDEAKQVLALLAERQGELTAKGMKAFDKGAVDAQALAETGKETEAARAAYDEQLKNVLGADKFAKFQEYERTIGERFALDQVQRQLAAGGTPLEEKQTQGLLEIMKQERQQTPPTPFDAANRGGAAQAQAMQSDEAVNGWIKTQEDYNRRVLTRARTVLSPDQILAFEAAQKQQMEMQQMGVKMGREFFKAK